MVNSFHLDVIRHTINTYYNSATLAIMQNPIKIDGTPTFLVCTKCWQNFFSLIMDNSLTLPRIEIALFDGGVEASVDTDSEMRHFIRRLI